jgi:hypothetical protein
MAKLKDGTRIYGNANIDSTLTTLDLVVTGNMTIQGTTTTVDSTITTIEDPVITLGTNVAPDGLDRGLILQYNDGAAKTGFLGWDQSLGEFALASTTTWDSANNVVTIGTYGNIHGLHFIGQGDTLANINGANVTGTVPNANNSAFAGNVTGNAQANITSVGTLTGLTVGNATANTTFGNGTITAGGVVSVTDASTSTSTTSGALQVTGGAGVGGNLYVGGSIYGNFAGNIAAKGNNTEVQYNDAGVQNASAAFTFNNSSNSLTVSGTVTGGNLSTAGTLSVTGNANVGNLGTAGLITATGTVTGGNLSTAGTLSVTGNANVGNLGTAGLITATGNVSGGNLTTAGDVTTVTLTASGNISTTANLSVTGTANVTGIANAAGGFRTGANIDGTGASSSLNIKYIEATGTANITSTLTAGNLSTAGTANVTGNATVGNLSTAGMATVGNLTMSVGALVTGNLIPSADVTYDLGNSTRAWRDLYLSGSSIRLGTQVISSNADGVTLSNSINTTNITASNLISTLTLTASGAITGANVTANNLSNTQVAFADGSKIVGSSSFIFTSSTGTLSANLFTGTLTTNAQPNITSVGTLTDLTVTNVATANINGYSSTVSASAQSNITSVGTLTSLVSSGNIQSNANVITDNILAKGTNVTVTAGTGGNIVLAPEGSGTVDVSSKRITGLATPTQATDAATKGYVDGAAQGLDIKNSVRVATTTNITLSGTQTVDSVVLVAGNRVLVKDQTNASQNGIYVVSASSWTRALDADDNGELTAGSFTFIEEGTSYHDTGWVISTNGEIVIGTDPMNWTQFSGAGQLTASDGVQLIGSNFSANVDNSTIAVVSGALKVKDGLTLTTPNIGVATGTSLNLGSGTIDSGNITVAANADITLSGADSQITGANLVSANYFTGTLTTASQPNITSVGTLGNLSITTTLNVASNAFIANSGGIYTDGYYYANGIAIDFSTAAGNATELQFKATGSNDLAASPNLTFSGTALTVTGTANVSGQVTVGNLKTDSLTTGRVTLQGAGNVLADSGNLTFSGTELTVTGTANVSGQVIAGNVKTASLTVGRVTFAGTGNVLADDAELTFDTITNELQSGNANVAGYLTAGNVTARNLTTAGRIVIAGSAGLLSDNANLSFNSTGNILTVDNVTSSGNVNAGQFIGNGVQISNIAGGNVSGTVANATLAVSVSGNAQGNITSVGTLTGLTVTGLTTLDTLGNLKITGGANGQIISTDGAGNLSFISNDSGKIVNGTSNVSIPTLNGNIVMVQGGTTVLTVTGVGANITGSIDVTGNISGNNISAANTITASANTDSTSSITGTIKVTGGMAATGNIYTGKSVGFANNNGGTASKAYIQFNDTANSLDFIFN